MNPYEQASWTPVTCVTATTSIEGTQTTKALLTVRDCETVALISIGTSRGTCRHIVGPVSRTAATTKRGTTTAITVTKIRARTTTTTTTIHTARSPVAMRPRTAVCIVVVVVVVRALIL